MSRTTNMKFIMEFVNHFLNPEGRITFLHVLTSDAIPISPGEWRQALSAISTSHLLSSGGSPEVSYTVRNARSIVDGIVDALGKEPYDLVLFANSTYRKRLNHLFGSKVDEVIRRSPVDVVVLSYRDDRPLKYDKILVPTSGYKHALKAAKMAEILSKRHGGEITLLHVGESDEDPRPIFSPIADDLKSNGVRHRMVCRHGHVIDTILDEAENGFGLMMIGATERLPPYQFIIGSTADRLVKRSPCPVLIVKTV